MNLLLFGSSLSLSLESSSDDGLDSRGSKTIMILIDSKTFFPLANSFAKWENVRRLEAPYGTRLRGIRTTLCGA